MQNHMLTPKGTFQSVLANHVEAEKYQSKANLSLQHWQLWCVYIQPGLHIPKHLSFELWWTIQWLHLPCAILWSLVLYLQFQHSHLKVKTSVLEHQLQNSSDSPLSWGGSDPGTRFTFPIPSWPSAVQQKQAHLWIIHVWWQQNKIEKSWWEKLNLIVIYYYSFDPSFLLWHCRDVPSWDSLDFWYTNLIFTDFMVWKLYNDRRSLHSTDEVSKVWQMKTCWWVSDHQSVWCQRFQLLHKG
jgi:hypothetical protein